MIDLHCHSTCSDGALSPLELLDCAEALGIQTLALTDHDTVDGVEEFMACAQARAVEAVPGVEVACQGPKSLVMHVVGLWCDHTDTVLLKLLEGIRDHRQDRNVKMIDRLSDLGCPVAWADVSAEAGDGVMGRPHFARVLVDKGFCRDHRDAFTRFLARGKPAYVRRQLPPVSEALEILSGAGAVCIWAHPLMSKTITGAKLHRVAKSLMPHGLDGIECYYSEYSLNQVRKALRHAGELGLLASGGSDFHGGNIPGISLGTGRGDLCVPPEILPPLRHRAALKRTVPLISRSAPLAIPDL